MKFFDKDLTKTFSGDFPHIGAVMVSKMVIDEHVEPRFMYREKRTRQDDSGWRIFTGFETDEYLHNSYNMSLYEPATIVRIDPAIAPLLLKGVGSVYEKDEQNHWTKVTDFVIEDDFMITHKLTDDWVIDINNLFERRLEESGDLLFTTGDKSIRITVWNAPGKTKDSIYAEYQQMVATRDQSQTKTLETFDLSSAALAKLGYLIHETDGEKSYHVLYGFSIINEEIAQTVLYFDDEADQSWALDTWKSVRPSEGRSDDSVSEV